ncbi:MAG: rhomboid family intramembrane serine protease [Candidatus Omnitrophica bacterium]|nr:rhomboid family intramembrane serine protease [Candidatus Omnitrophota bacterium]
MLEDRYYMRDTNFAPRLSVTVVILLLNAVIFVVQSILERYSNWPIFDYFALSAAGLLKGRIWQLITFQFMHGSVMHLLVNSLVIYVFGRALEETLSRGPFLRLYLLSGVAGGLVQFMAQWLWPAHFPDVPVIGASAGAFGLVAAYAIMFPERPLTVLLAFIIPITMRAKYLLVISFALALFGIVVPTGNVAHAAHLGGILGGLAYVYGTVLSPMTWFRWPTLRTVSRTRELVSTAASRRSVFRRHKRNEEEDLPPAEFISREVDPILDKISAHGIQSLTQRERQILEAARNKMAKR